MSNESSPSCKLREENGNWLTPSKPGKTTANIKIYPSQKEVDQRKANDVLAYFKHRAYKKSDRIELDDKLHKVP